MKLKIHTNIYVNLVERNQTRIMEMRVLLGIKMLAGRENECCK